MNSNKYGVYVVRRLAAGLQGEQDVLRAVVLYGDTDIIQTALYALHAPTNIDLNLLSDIDECENNPKEEAITWSKLGDDLENYEDAIIRAATYVGDYKVIAVGNSMQLIDLVK